MKLPEKIKQSGIPGWFRPDRVSLTGMLLLAAWLTWGWPGHQAYSVGSSVAVPVGFAITMILMLLVLIGTFVSLIVQLSYEKYRWESIGADEIWEFLDRYKVLTAQAAEFRELADELVSQIRSLRSRVPSVERLKALERDLVWRGKLNLVGGLALSVLGVLYLIFFEQVSGLVGAKWDLPPGVTEHQVSFYFLKYGLARLGPALFMGVLAFFFLRLYRKTQDEEKRVHAELNTLENVNYVLVRAQDEKNTELLQKTLLVLLERERNPDLVKPGSGDSKKDDGDVLDQVKKLLGLVKDAKDVTKP